jgi:beta-glucosidase|nr:Fibronectin type III-like domain [uncultured bacterium]
MGPDAVTYNESIYVGYRYYDKAHVDVRFPFGYGLSYTSFAYSGLTLSRKVLAPGKAIEVLFTVENTGAMAGVETAQVYVAHRNSAAHQPVRTLAGFARVALKPGERKTVCVTLPPSALEFYDVARHAFVVEAGRYEVSVGRHSRCLLLHAAFTARGETVALPPAHSAGGPYGSFADNTFPDAAFAAIHTRPLPRNQKPVRGEYTQTTVLGDMLDSRTGRALHALALCAARLGMHFSNNPAVNRRVCEMTVRDLPFKNLVLNTSGIIRYPAAEALLALANGRLFSRGGTVRAERGRSRKG